MRTTLACVSSSPPLAADELNKGHGALHPEEGPSPSASASLKATEDALLLPEGPLRDRWAQSFWRWSEALMELQSSHSGALQAVSQLSAAREFPFGGAAGGESALSR